MYLWPERVNHDRHQRGSRGDDRRQKVNEPSRLIRNDVFFEDEFEQVGERLQKSARADAVRAQTALDKTEHAAFGEHRVRDHRHHNREGDKDAGQQPGNMY